MNRIYLDNNLTTPVIDEVLKEMMPYFNKDFGISSGLYNGSLIADEAIEKAQKQVAKVINADPGQIIFTASGSEANLIAIRGLAQSRKSLGEHLITSRTEHASVLDLFKQLEKEGYDVDYLEVDSDGFIDINALVSVLRKDTNLVSIMHVNHITGTIQPIHEIAKAVKKHNKNSDAKTIFHTDACEGFGKLPIDINKLGVDALSMSSHMIHGPKGAGGLYLRKGLSPRTVIHGSDSRFKYRKGAENVPAIVGFGKAAELAGLGIHENIRKISKVQNFLMKGIEKDIPEVKLNGPTSERRSPYNVNYSFRFVEGEALTLQLDMHDIAVGTGSACASQSLKANYVLLAMGRKHEEAHGSLRFTLNRFNTMEEIVETLKTLKSVFNNLMKFSIMKPN